MIRNSSLKLRTSTFSKEKEKKNKNHAYYRGLKVLTRSNFTNFKGVPHPLYRPRGGGCFRNIKNPIGKTYFLFHVSGVELYVKITTKSMYKRSRNNLYCSKNQNTIYFRCVLLGTNSFSD